MCPVLSTGRGAQKAPARGAIADLMMTVVTVGRGEGMFSVVTQGSAVLHAAELSG